MPNPWYNKAAAIDGNAGRSGGAVASACRNRRLARDQIKAISYDLEYAATNRTQLLKRFQDALIKTQ